MNSQNEEQVIPNEQVFKTTSVALIEKLLQFPTPRLDSKIVNVLLLEGMMDIFMTHVSRLQQEGQEKELSSYSLKQKIQLTQHERDISDLEAMKRSYHAMEFLSGTTANHLWVQNSTFYTIVEHLFEVFLPNSNGNFNHFFKIFQHLGRRNPCDMLQFVIMRNKATILFDSMLPYITQGPILDSLLNLIFVRDINQETKDQREECHHELQRLGFLEWMVDAIELKENPVFVEAAQELFSRVITEASQVDNGDILFASLKTDKGKDIIELLVKDVIEYPPSKERERTINIIKLLVRSGLLTTRASAISQPVEGPLYTISTRVQELLAIHIPEFCHVLGGPETKSSHFTTSDMDLLDIIYQILYNANEKTEMLASTTSSFWKILVKTFFEKSTCNIYHTLFYRIICLVFASHHEPTLDILFHRESLVKRLIDEYQDTKRITETRGFILLILNQLRLMMDAHQSDFLTNNLNSDTQFQDFLPQLRKDTFSQVEPIYKWKLDACPRPPAHIGPSPPIQAVHFSPYTGTLPLMSNVAEHDEAASGIDLGSDFAYCLGFKETELSRTSSFVNDHQDFPMDIIWGESLTADDD